MKTRDSITGPHRPDISLSVFFPAYYDEKNIDRVVHEAVAVLEDMDLADYEIIIVEDGSPDRTAEVADELAARYEKVRVVHHPVNRGYGMALRTGFAEAGMDYVFYSDGDKQYDLTELRKFVALIPYTDIVSGFRIKKQYSLYRQVTSYSYNLILRLLFGLNDRDVDCAFKLYPRELFERIELDSKDAFIDAEIAIKARKLGYRTTEVGVTHLPRLDGLSTAARPSAIFRAFKEIFKAWRNYRLEVEK